MCCAGISLCAVSMPNVSPYGGLWGRLMAASEPENDSEQACWAYALRTKCRYGYGRVNVWVPGLKKRVKLTAHILAYILLESKATTVNDAYLAYLEFRCSGLELDHCCVNTSCLRPD